MRSGEPLNSKPPLHEKDEAVKPASSRNEIADMFLWNRTNISIVQTKGYRRVSDFSYLVQRGLVPRPETKITRIAFFIERLKKGYFGQGHDERIRHRIVYLERRASGGGRDDLAG